MAKQSFVTGQVLTAQQVNDLQTNDFNQTVSAKTASYTLVAADKGTRITMSSTSATTITVNTGLFAAGDTLFIQNINTGVATITAGTATVNTSSSLALAQWEGGTLYFTSASAAIFFKSDGAAAGAGGKVLQVVMGTTSTQTSITSTTMTDTDLSVAITPSSATSKVLILVSQQFEISKGNAVPNAGWRLMRGATEIFDGSGDAAQALGFFMTASSTETYVRTYASIVYLDSPSTTSATTYKTQARVEASGSSPYVIAQRQTCQSSIIALEIGA